MKSILMSIYGSVGIGKGMYNPVFVTFPLEFGNLTNMTTLHIPPNFFSHGGLKIDVATSCTVLSLPTWPLLCNSFINLRRKLGYITDCL